MAKSKKGTGPGTSNTDSVNAEIAEDATLPAVEGADSVGAEETVVAVESDDSVAEGDAPEGDIVDATAESVSDAEGEDTLAGDVESAEPAKEQDTPEAEETPAAEAEPELHEEGSDVAATEEDDTVGEDADEVSPDVPEAPEPEAEPAMAAAVAPQVIEKTVVERKGGFGSMLLGGVVAAALGYGAGAWPDLPFMESGEPVEDPFQTETRAALGTQGDQLAGLSAKLDETAGAVAGIDLEPLTSAVTGLEDTLADADARLTGLGDQLAGFDSRLTAVEKQPMAEAVSPEAIAAYERELQALRDSMTEQKAILDAQRAEIQTMARDAVAAEESADEKAELAQSNAALADVLARVQDGRPYAEPLAVLSGNGVAVPGALEASAEDGLPTITALAEGFPDAARDALIVARRATAAEGDSSGLTSFFQNQLGARSVTPREGDDPDAVLSRAEAAVKASDLEAALTEIAALPEPAQEVLSGWVSQAELRRDALAAAQGLAQELNNAQGSN